MVREEGNKESVATTTCLTLQNQEEGKKLNGKNSQKHSKQGSDCIKVKFKKSLDLKRGPQIRKRSLMLNRHCVRVFSCFLWVIYTLKATSLILMLSVTKSQGMTYLIRRQKSPNRHRTNSTVPSQVSFTSQCIIVQIHQCSCTGDKIPEENSRQTSML
jgi:hypothetical protein